VPLPKVLRWFWIGSLAAFGLTLLVSFLEYRAGMNQYRWFPFDPPFWDLMDNAATIRLLHTKDFFYPVNSPPVAYPPFGAMQLALLHLSGHPKLVFLAIALTAIGVGIWGVRRALMRYGIHEISATLFPLTIVLVSFPIVRLVYQGNIEIFLWIFAATGTWVFLHGRDDAAAILWGLAAASKLYPLALLLLFLPRRKYRAFAIGLGVFAVVSLFSLAYLGPDIGTALQGSLHDVFGYQQYRAGEWSTRELHANHSLFLLVKFAAVVFGVSGLMLTNAYYLIGSIVFLAIFWGRLRKMPVANQLMGVSIFMLTLPTISYFHTLVNLYAPLLLLFLLAVRAERDGVKIHGLSATILLFLPLFVSFQLFTFPTYLLFCGLVQIAVLIWLFLCVLQYPFEEPSGVR
jgi:hypothetical protein